MTGKEVLKTGVLIALTCTLLFSCRSDRDVILEELKRLELSSYEKNDLDKKTEAELLEAIRFLEGEVSRTVSAGTHLGSYYKMVAVAYQNRELYGLAADYYLKALEIAPTNPILAYRAGLCIAQTAAALPTDAGRMEKIDQAATLYQHAVELNPKYVDALYALAIIYVFEYDRPADAEHLLERILAVESLNYHAMFVLARIYVTYGRIDDAVDLYERVIENSQLDDLVFQARANRNELLGGRNAR